MTQNDITRPTTVVGIFVRREDLENALEQLRAAGFSEQQTGVTMRGLRQDEAQDPSDYPEVQDAARSVLMIRVDGRDQEAEEILRRCGAADIHWTNAMTTGLAGSTQEIVDSET